MRLSRTPVLVTLIGMLFQGLIAEGAGAEPIAAEARFHYQDLERAVAFYREHLGLVPVETREDAVVLELAPGAYLTLATLESAGFSPATPRTAAIALVTDQLDEWWAALSVRDLTMRTKAYEPEPGGPHDGFVLVDPEGWFLEFERFNAHPENVQLMPRLDALPTRLVDGVAAGLPEGLGFKASILWLYYDDLERAERFVVSALDLPLITDQGWAKIHPVTTSAYLGLVDAARGMHSFTDEKAVIFAIIDADAEVERDRLANLGLPTTRVNASTFELRDPGNHRLRWRDSDTTYTSSLQTPAGPVEDLSASCDSGDDAGRNSGPNPGPRCLALRQDGTRPLAE